MEGEVSVFSLVGVKGVKAKGPAEVSAFLSNVVEVQVSKKWEKWKIISITILNCLVPSSGDW